MTTDTKDVFIPEFLPKDRVIWNLTKADKSAKMIIGKTLTNYHYGNIGTTGFGTIFSSGHI